MRQLPPRMGNSASAVEPESSEKTHVWLYKIGLSGRGVRPGEYTYAYVSAEFRIVIEPGHTHPIRTYNAEEWRDIDNEKKQVPVRVSLLRNAQRFLKYEDQITNEIQRQLAVN